MSQLSRDKEAKDTNFPLLDVIRMWWAERTGAEKEKEGEKNDDNKPYPGGSVVFRWQFQALFY